MPKGALVEYQVNLHTGRTTEHQLEQGHEESGDVQENNNDDDDDDLEAVYSNGKNTSVCWEISTTSSRSSRGSRAIIFCRGELESTLVNVQLTS